MNKSKFLLISLISIQYHQVLLDARFCILFIFVLSSISFLLISFSFSRFLVFNHSNIQSNKLTTLIAIPSLCLLAASHKFCYVVFHCHSVQTRISLAISSLIQESFRDGLFHFQNIGSFLDILLLLTLNYVCGGKCI